MTLIAKTTTIPTNAIVKANNVNLTKVVAKNTTVWEKVVFTSKEFNYNGTNGTDGSVQEWEVPADGTYQIEVYGAQGGGYYEIYKYENLGEENETATLLEKGNSGGKGGYAKGTKYLTAGTKLYICIGGAGNGDYSGAISNITAGYNGGGRGDGYNYGTHHDAFGGGGCTHIALGTNRGELKNYNSFRSEVLIVAGGGGGAGTGSRRHKYYGGGNGGGLNGGNSVAYDSYNDHNGQGATQSYGGFEGGSFGCAASSSRSGGGGGWYGGGAGGDPVSTNNRIDEDEDGNDIYEEFGSGGGGGSGYIGGMDSGSFDPNITREGHGLARITYIGS